MEAHFIVNKDKDYVETNIKDFDKKLFKEKYNRDEYLILGIVESENATAVENHLVQYNVPLNKLPKDKIFYSYHRFFNCTEQGAENSYLAEGRLFPDQIAGIIIAYSDFMKIINNK